jgi:CHRD domain
VIWLTGKTTVPNPIEGQATLTEEQAQQLMAGEWYVNGHTQANPNGEIRGQLIPPKN